MTLRIAFFVHEFPALSETFVLNQVTGLLRLGSDVSVLATRPRADPMKHEDVQRYRLDDRTIYLSMPASRKRRLATAFPILVRQVRRNPRQLLRALNPFRYGRRATSLELLFWLDRLDRGGSRYDAILCHFGLIGRTAAFLREIGALHGALVTVFHGVDISSALRREPNLYRHLFRHGDLFLAISRRWRNRLIDHGCDSSRTLVHHMGVDPSRFAVSSHAGVGTATLRVLTIGRLIEKKGVEYGLRAVARARDRGARLHYTIIGDGPLRESLTELAAALDLTGIVNFVGWQEQDMIVAYLRRSQVLLAPSVMDRQGEEEGIPVTLMEAMATGMPVVSTRHSGIPELVEDGVSGLLADERDVHGLATALCRLERDPALRDALGRQARKSVTDGFNVRVLNTQLLDLLTGLARTGEQSGDRQDDIRRQAERGISPASAIR
jgi:colanic acid/amylovoran biosynthesis glycosyltransferase